MHVVATLFGLLLLLFGGGCTLILLVSAVDRPRNLILADIGLLLQMWIPLGLIPLVGGWFLFRYGLKRSNEKIHQGGPPSGNTGAPE